MIRTPPCSAPARKMQLHTISGTPTAPSAPPVVGDHPALRHGLNPNHVTVRLRGSVGCRWAPLWDRSLEVSAMPTTMSARGLGGTPLSRHYPRASLRPKCQCHHRAIIRPYGDRWQVLFRRRQAGERFAVREFRRRHVGDRGQVQRLWKYMTGGSHHPGCGRRYLAAG